LRSLSHSCSRIVAWRHGGTAVKCAGGPVVCSVPRIICLRHCPTGVIAVAPFHHATASQSRPARSGRVFKATSAFTDVPISAITRDFGNSTCEPKNHGHYLTTPLIRQFKFGVGRRVRRYVTMPLVRRFRPSLGDFGKSTYGPKNHGLYLTTPLVKQLKFGMDRMATPLLRQFKFGMDRMARRDGGPHGPA